MKKLLTAIILLVLTIPNLSAQNGSEKDGLIKQILMVEQHQREQVHSVMFDAEYIEGEDKDGEFIEKVRFDKKISVKYLEDTALFHEEFLAFYKEGELQDEGKLSDEAKDRKDKKEKRKAKDISYSMLEPFHDTALYNIDYLGIANDSIEGYICHHFKVEAKEEDPDLINGDFYFDSESFQLVRVDFRPAKLVKKMMFKMKEFDMSILFAPTDENFWFPKQFDIAGKGKAMFFIGVKFAGTEYYRNPQVNVEIPDELFAPNDEN